jgi:hypothetical protein
MATKLMSPDPTLREGLAILPEGGSLTPSQEEKLNMPRCDGIQQPPTSLPTLTADVAWTERRKDFGFLPIPRRLRHHPDRPPAFGLALNAGFAVASSFGE